MKKEIPVSSANRLINHGPAILLTSQGKKGPNIITLAWSTPVSHDPMLVAISVACGHYSNRLIKNSGEFVINIPNTGLLKQLDYCGSVSGREADKFKDTGLTSMPANKVKPPLIKECIGHLECKLAKAVPAGDHTVFIGEVVYACAEEGLFNKHWLVNKKEAKTIHYLGGCVYTYPDKIIS